MIQQAAGVPYLMQLAPYHYRRLIFIEESGCNMP
jgi:hypothetical protein